MDTRTEAQREALQGLLRELHQRFPKALIVGHQDLDPSKSCPCFNVVNESSDIANPDTVPIVVLTVSAHLFKGPTGLDRTIGRDDKVISAAFPAERAMQMVDVHHP